MSREARNVAPYDALLLVSFGGPEEPDDVVPFLENVTRGKAIPRERLEEVGAHYYEFGGRSPINDQNRELLRAIAADFTDHGIDLPLYWGNRNWDPYLTETLQTMADDGIQRAACFVTSAYSSYSGCRQYREDLAAASQGVDHAPQLDRLRHYFNHPGFVAANVDAVRQAVDEIGGTPRLVFVTHSIPTAMNDSSGPGGGAYVAQHLSAVEEIADAVSAAVGTTLERSLTYCSRSGPPQMSWLEPDINDFLTERAAAGENEFVVAPIGFISDHMEVIYDLDTEARATATELGVQMVRAGTAGVRPSFVASVRELLVERAAAERGEAPPRPACGDLPASHDLCPVQCCPNPRTELPVIGSA